MLLGIARWTALLLLGTGIGGAGPLCAAGAHSAVAVKGRWEGKALSLDFVVEPQSALHINDEGPWRLELAAVPAPLKLTKSTWDRSDFDAKLPGFKVRGEALGAAPVSGKVAYKLTAFVCTNDKTQCYRDVLTGETALPPP